MTAVTRHIEETPLGPSLLGRRPFSLAAAIHRRLTPMFRFAVAARPRSWMAISPPHRLHAGNNRQRTCTPALCQPQIPRVPSVVVPDQPDLTRE